MEQKHKDILIAKRVELIENINIKDGLFTQLLTRRIFNQRSIRKIKTFNTTDEQIEELLDELPRRGPKAFDEFCEALIADDQEDVVNLYLRPKDSNSTTEQTENLSATQTSATTSVHVSNVPTPTPSTSVIPQTIVTMPQTMFTTPSAVAMATPHINMSSSVVSVPSSQITQPSIQSGSLSNDVQDNGQYQMALCVSNSPSNRFAGLQGFTEPPVTNLSSTEDRYMMKHFILDPNYKGVSLKPPKDVADAELLPDNPILKKVALENLAYSDLKSLYSQAGLSFEKNTERWPGFNRTDSLDTMHKRPYIPNPEYVNQSGLDANGLENLHCCLVVCLAKRLRTEDTVVLPIHDATNRTQIPTTMINNNELDNHSFHPIGGEFDDPDIDLTDGPVKVQVALSTRQFFLAHYKKSYAMRRIPRGKALIINVNEVEGKPPRRGTDIDRDNLHNLLTQLHFDVTVHNDCNGFYRTLPNLQDHQHADSTVICLLSHGEDGYIFGTDGKKILLDDVFSLFDNKHCKLLIQKPKIFIIQACRGGALDSGIPVPHLDETDGSDTNQKQLPSQSDMLICYPTQAGYYAWRNRERGSWYIEALVHVNHLVSRKISRCPQIDMDQMSQMSEYKSTLRMPHLFFFPGIGCAHLGIKS
ncbi:hypothetical protein KUTeg_001985 [Tegillarca granosa]|uniref:Caspase-2 n=1 Tax=Tegillarca granosa TaxID=220873 RepID=A0ABQ9FXF3_TEGGR|nr:hypothetical protein KUTeg_001985 [Tegillarca granosa]